MVCCGRGASAAPPPLFLSRSLSRTGGHRRPRTLTLCEGAPGKMCARHFLAAHFAPHRKWPQSTNGLGWPPARRERQPSGRAPEVGEICGQDYVTTEHLIVHLCDCAVCLLVRTPPGLCNSFFIIFNIFRRESGRLSLRQLAELAHSSRTFRILNKHLSAGALVGRRKSGTFCSKVSATKSARHRRPTKRAEAAPFCRLGGGSSAALVPAEARAPRKTLEHRPLTRLFIRYATRRLVFSDSGGREDGRFEAAVAAGPDSRPVPFGARVASGEFTNRAGDHFWHSVIYDGWRVEKTMPHCCHGRRSVSKRFETAL